MPDNSKADRNEADRYAAFLAEARTIRGVSLGQDAWRRLKKNRVAMASLGVLATVALLTVFTPFLPLQSPREQSIANAFADPTWSPAPSLGILDADGTVDSKQVVNLFGELNPFNRLCLHARLTVFGVYSLPSLCGTDELGRDLLSRLFWGARISLLVGIVATLVSLVIGVSYGAVAGYFGGRIDNSMMRFVDVLYSVPFIFVVIFLITILNAEEIKTTLREDWGIDRITLFFFVIGAISWLTMARVVRGQVISLKHEQFIEAARTLGAGPPRIIFRHLVPNVYSVVIVYLTLTIPSVMLFEAFLSFLGLGVEPPDVSWGLLARDGTLVITPVRTNWWLVVYPGLALGVTLLALNFLGDGLRDALDPRMKNR